MKLTQAQIDRLRWLEDEAGRLTPDAVVADARSEDSPLHSLFDWDPAKAAIAWWTECAREIIRAVHIPVTGIHGECRVPIYVHDPSTAGQGYRSVYSLKVDPIAARQALRDELSRAAGVITRARSIAVAFDM